MGTKEDLKKTFSTNLIHYMKLANKSQANIIHDLKYGSGIVSEWVRGIKYPRMDKIQALADYLDIYKYQLIEPLSLQKKTNPDIKIPLYKSFMIEEEKVNYISYNTKKAKHKYFALSVTDDALYPDFHENDVIIIERTDKLAKGQIAVVEQNQKTKICMVENKASFNSDEIKILGIVKELKRFF